MHEQWLQKSSDVLILNGEHELEETFDNKLLAIKAAVQSWME